MKLYVRMKQYCEQQYDGAISTVDSTHTSITLDSRFDIGVMDSMAQ
jgi:hypothetical protein